MHIIYLVFIILRQSIILCYEIPWFNQYFCFDTETCNPRFRAQWALLRRLQTLLQVGLWLFIMYQCLKYYVYRLRGLFLYLAFFLCPLTFFFFFLSFLSLPSYIRILFIYADSFIFQLLFICLGPGSRLAPLTSPTRRSEFTIRAR